MSITVAQQVALEKAVVPIAYFVQFNFASAIVRVSNFNQPFTWGGFEWVGLGAIGAISEVVETDGLESSPLNFTLNVADPSLLAAAVGPVEEYRGRSARMYMAPLTENFEMIGDPVACWSGIMDMMSIGLDSDKGQIVLKCETAAYGLKRRPTLRMNAAQQKIRHPGDTSFDYLNSLISTPGVWLTKRFQQIT